MTLLASRHTIGTWGGGLIATDGSFIRDDLDVPDALTASGKSPTTSVLVNYLGGNEPNTGADRCERSISFSPREGGVYWADFYLKVQTFASTAGTTWNNLFQVRDSGSPANPSPSPTLCVQGTSLVIIRNLYDPSRGVFGQTQVFKPTKANTLDAGGDWHHPQVGFCWSEDPAKGWVEMWRDGVNVIPRTFTRTARESSAGADWRFGVYRDKNAMGDLDAIYRLYGLEIHDARPDAIIPPPPPDLPPTSTEAELRAIIAQTVSDLNASKEREGALATRIAQMKAKATEIVGL